MLALQLQLMVCRLLQRQREGQGQGQGRHQRLKAPRHRPSLGHSPWLQQSQRRLPLLVLLRHLPRPRPRPRLPVLRLLLVLCVSPRFPAASASAWVWAWQLCCLRESNRRRQHLATAQAARVQAAVGAVALCLILSRMRVDETAFHLLRLLLLCRFPLARYQVLELQLDLHLQSDLLLLLRLPQLPRCRVKLLLLVLVPPCRHCLDLAALLPRQRLLRLRLARLPQPQRQRLPPLPLLLLVRQCQQQVQVLLGLRLRRRPRPHLPLPLLWACLPWAMVLAWM